MIHIEDDSDLLFLKSFEVSHGPQASPCFLKRRVWRRLSPPRVAFSAWPWSFLSLIC
jgi:hypothetical protein